MVKVRYMIRLHLFRYLSWSILVPLNACHSINEKSFESKKEADTVVIHFYNASVAPQSQFYNTFQIVKDKYFLTTQNNNGGNIVEKINGSLPLGFWSQIAFFNPVLLNEQNTTDGETLMVEYHCKDSIYTHFPEQNSNIRQQVSMLLQLKK